MRTFSDNDQKPTPAGRRRLHAAVTVVTAAVVAGGVIAGSPSPLGAATPVATDVSFVGYSGGSFVRAVGTTVNSDLTAAASLNTVYSPATATNDAAGAAVSGVLSAGAVTTSVRTETISGGYRVVSTSRTAGISALGGAVKASAIETTSTASVVDGVASQSTDTRLVGLTVAGRSIPVTVAKNFVIRIPGVATVALNYAQGGAQGRVANTLGIGAYISLLSPRGGNGIGAEIAISPTYAALAPVKVPDSGHYLGGKAYGSSVTAKVGSLAEVHSDPTAPIGLGAFGSDGVTKSTSIAAINLSGALRLGAVRSTASGVNTKSRYEAATGNQIGGVNLLNGLIKADALSASARVAGTGSAAPTVTGSAGLVNLSIGGTTIPINAKPNTTVTLAKLAKVTVNQQVRTARSITVRALVITLTTAAYGLPVGAEIQIASASASAS